MAQKRVLYFDILNICACICVVYLHFNSLTFSYEPTLAWKQSLAIEVLCYWAVPIFFMLSGANLLKYRERYSTKEFFKKRFLRTVIPFVFWSMFIMVLKQLAGNIDILSWNAFEVIDYIFNTKVEPVYWFFIPLFSAYLCMPVLSLIAKRENKRTLWYAVSIAFLLFGIMPVILNFIELPWNAGINFPVLGGYLIFVVLGYLLSITDVDKGKRILIYILGLLSITFRYLVTYLLSTKEHNTVMILFDYTQFHSVLLAISVFVLFKQINWEKLFSSSKTQNVIATISSCSFGVYLIHMLLQRVAVYVLGLSSDSWGWRLLLPLGIYVVGVVTVYCMKKIPVVKYLVP